MRVLIVDDEKTVCDLLEQFVQACGHEVVGKVSGGGVAGIKAFAALEPDAVLLDVMMPRCNGLTVCHAVRSRSASAKVVLMSGMYDDRHVFVRNSGADACLPKPLLFSDVRAVLERLQSPFQSTAETSPLTELSDLAEAG